MSECSLPLLLNIVVWFAAVGHDLNQMPRIKLCIKMSGPTSVGSFCKCLHILYLLTKSCSSINQTSQPSTNPYSFTTPSQSWLNSMVTSSMQSTNANSFAIDTASVELLPDLVRYLDGCPQTKTEVKELCRGGYSSANRCGETSESHGVACHCDQHCSAYNDCCWDFMSECGIHHFSSGAPTTFLASSASVSCLGKEALVVNDCGYRADNDFMAEEKDFRKPVVNVKGVSFINKTVYQCFERNPSRTTVKMKSWYKSIKVYSYDDFGILQEFVLTGKKDPKLAVKDYVPPDLRYRECRPWFESQCTPRADGHEMECGNLSGHITTFDAEHVSEFCSFMEMKSEILGEGWVVEMISPLLNDQKDTQESTRNFGDGKNNVSDVSDTETTNTPAICSWTKRHQDVKETMGNSTKPGPVFTVIADFQHLNRPVFHRPGKEDSAFGGNLGISESATAHLECQYNIGSDKCDSLSVVCLEGFIPIGLRCREPKRLEIEVCGSKDFRLLNHLMKDVFNVILTENSKSFTLKGGTLDLAAVRQESTNRLCLSGHLHVRQYELSYIGTRLPFTDIVLRILNETKTVPDNSDAMKFCLNLKGLNGEKRWFICDHMEKSFNGYEVHRHSVKQQGASDTLPDPSADDEKTNLAAISSHGNFIDNRWNLFVGIFLLCIFV